MAQEQETTEQAPKKKPIVPILIILVLLAGSIGGTLYFMGFFSGKSEEAKKDAHAEKKVEKEPIYFAFEHPFTVNFETEGGLRFLQVQVEVMSHDPQAIKNLQIHMPAIRNDMIFILSSVPFEELVTREGKEKLRQAVLDDIRKVLKDRTGDPGIEEVYFTNFVMQ